MATEQTVLAVIRASRPSFKNRHDKAAFAVHAIFISVGYVLHATGPPAFTDDALSSTTTDEGGMDCWNEFEDNYAFLYSNPDKGSKKVLVKCLVMNDSLLVVDVLKNGDSDPLHLEIDVMEYVNDDGETNYGAQFKNLGKLVGEVNKEIIAKLDGSPVTTSSSSQPSRSESNLRDDRDQIGAGSYFPEQARGVVPPIPGYRGNDLYPRTGAGILYDFGSGSMLSGPNDPRFFGPGIGGPGLPGGLPVVPPIPGYRGNDLYPRTGAGMYPIGSMLSGPNDPRFFGPGIGGPGLPGGLPGGVLPGARFDPYGPPGVPGFEPDRFVRRPRRPGGGRLHPDLEQFPGGSGRLHMKKKT